MVKKDKFRRTTELYQIQMYNRVVSSTNTAVKLRFRSEDDYPVRNIDEPVRLSNEPARIGGPVRLRNEPVRVVKNLFNIPVVIAMPSMRTLVSACKLSKITALHLLGVETMTTCTSNHKTRS